jgi:GH15 family glucan-1,4-alpha-glucosidase
MQFMQSVFEGCKIPESATADEKALLQQSITILKMSQVPEQEILPYAHGQIVASLRPGEWSMTWVRDGSFAIAAMAKLGMNSEAKRGLEFMLKAQPVGRFKDIFRNGKDYGIGVDYQISATRYYGNGKEDCEASEGPTIEIDDFGLFLFALAEYMESSNDEAFYKQWESVLSEKIADAIMHNIDGDGLIRSDSGPWEHPLPGRRYTFTSGVCAEGLRRFAALQEKYGYESKKYAGAADSLYSGIMKHMVYENRVIKGDADDQSPTAHYFHDAGTFELFANGLVTDKRLFETHMQDYDRVMKVKNDIGYIRVFSDDTYENQEWPFADLRVAVAQNHLGARSLAKGLIDKVTKLSKANYNMIPEMYMLGNCSFNGAVPMVGYGSGAYVLALLDYYGDDSSHSAPN